MSDALTADAVHLGLDLGTQSARAVAVDGTGRLLARATATFIVLPAPGAF